MGPRSRRTSHVSGPSFGIHRIRRRRAALPYLFRAAVLAAAFAFGAQFIPLGVAATAPQLVPVALSYTPAPGDPLLVTFTATIVTGTPTLFNWTFGDGQYWNGSGPGFFSPVHRYPGDGTYTASVVVHEGTDTGSQSLRLTLAADPLVVRVVADNLSGSVPFTVTFNVSVTGGTGTYASFLWDFGDGGHGSGLLGVQYTYARPGKFHASVNATDSSGHSAQSSVEIDANPATEALTSSNSLGLFATIGIGVIVGAAGAVVLLGLLGRRFDSRSRQGNRGKAPSADSMTRGARPPAVNGRPEGIAPEVGRGVRTKTTPDEPARSARGDLDSVPSRSSEEPELDTSKLPGRSSRVLGPTGEVLRTSQRIVLHLAGLGVLGRDEVAVPGFTQAGIALGLGIRQNALTNVLRRLVAAGVVAENVRHVTGQPRRLKVYTLTPRGEALAHDLRRTPP